MKKHIILGFLALFLLAIPTTGYAKTGKHTGEEKYLEYEIQYLVPKGITYVHDEGIWFISDDPSLPNTYLTDLLPEEYFGEYPLYFIEDTLNFEVHITNIGKRKFNNLHVIAIHELLEIDGSAGEPFDGGEFEWFVDEIKSGETVVLTESMEIPEGSPNGIDQTHLKILHGKGNGDLDDEPQNGRVIVDNPQAGLWCPVELYTGQ